MAATAQRESTPRTGALRRSLSRAAPRVPDHVFDQPLTNRVIFKELLPAANDMGSGDSAYDVGDQREHDTQVTPQIVEQCCPERGLRFAFQPCKSWRDAGLIGAFASFLMHGGAIAAAIWLFQTVAELPPVGEEAIPIEFIVAGDTVDSVATEEGARAETPPITPPDLPETPPVDIAKELPQVDVPTLPETPAVDVAAALPTVSVPPPPDAPPIDVPPPPQLVLDLPAPPDAPLLADLTPPVLAVAPTAPEQDAVPPAHALPKPAEKPVEPKPVHVAKPVQPKRIEPKKVEPKRVEPRKVAVTPPQENPAPRRTETATQTKQNARGAAGEGDSDQRRVSSNRGGGAAAVANYRSQVLAHLARFKVYPEQARERGVTGRAAVAFTLSRGGQVVSASLSASSGAPILDQATLAMVRRAAPFPAMPEGGAAAMSFNAGINYNLR